jgi:hypothetical protein
MTFPDNHRLTELKNLIFGYGTTKIVELCMMQEIDNVNANLYNHKVNQRCVDFHTKRKRALEYALYQLKETEDDYPVSEWLNGE